jgi:hypothetical protein
MKEGERKERERGRGERRNKKEK